MLAVLQGIEFFFSAASVFKGQMHLLPHVNKTDTWIIAGKHGY